MQCDKLRIRIHYKAKTDSGFAILLFTCTNSRNGYVKLINNYWVTKIYSRLIFSSPCFTIRAIQQCSGSATLVLIVILNKSNVFQVQINRSGNGSGSYPEALKCEKKMSSLKECGQKCIVVEPKFYSRSGC